MVHLLVTAALLVLVAKMVSGIEVKGWGSAIVAALALGLVNALIKPLVVLLTLPITLLTLGLFYLVVNTLMLWLMAAIVPGFQVKGFGPAFIGALLLMLLNILVGAVFGV